MSASTPKAEVAFIAEVKDVKEVALVAEADLAFWQDRLAAEELFPYDNGGKAELTISATELRWMGARSNEFTIGVSVCERQGSGVPDGQYLVQAFNSSRLFAWVERTFFQTPYDPGRIQVDDRMPPTIELRDAEGLVVGARLAADAPPVRREDELWQGPIFLPRAKARRRERGRFFVARLGGYTETYAASPAGDAPRINRRQGYPVFQWLIESNLVAREWRVRSSALHARSKTFTRA